MFDPQKTPRIFALGLGVDFPKALVAGLRKKMQGQPPEAMARIQLIVNTARMRRRVSTLFMDGTAQLLPQITLLSDLGKDPKFNAIPQAVSPLVRRIELISLVDALLRQNPSLAARSSLFDLAESLAALMDEMQGEGVSLADISNLEVTDVSGHWARAQNFIGIVGRFLDQSQEAPDTQARARAVALAQITEWTHNPPEHPVIIAGSTGSRGTTALLMQAAANLPQGAVVLPGFDRDMPETVWDELIAQSPARMAAEDHPQYRFAKMLQDLSIHPKNVPNWHETAPADSARNKVVSLALRPVPVTDGWLRDGPDLGDLPSAMQGITLLEPQTAREEALAIAMRLRMAAEEGKTAALITPDRMLTRQVTAALDRWDIKPDDSAGMPLQLSPPGRFLRHVIELFTRPLDAEALLTLLKHPMTHSGSERGAHLLLTRELELSIRKNGPAFPDAASLGKWAKDNKLAGAAEWAEWVAQTFCGHMCEGTQNAVHLAERHIDLAERISQGRIGNGSGELWNEGAGREALKQWEALHPALDALPDLSARDYADLLGGILSRGEVRNPDVGHPNVLIWGTLEARVQGADLLILAGLNEGSWPEAPSPDPWLNRRMRAGAGLLLPERRIGLSAHDFEQAIAAPEVWLTRAQRSDDAQTVPSRWLNRLTNLMDGLKGQHGPEAIKQMQARGNAWLERARQLEAPIETPPAPRPSPCPPLEVRPNKLSVTEIKTLVRDPYAIYAKHVLGLNPLESLVKTADARLRGIAVHQVFEDFVKNWDDTRTAGDLVALARHIFAKDVDWPSARLMWAARIARLAQDFVFEEQQRQQNTVSSHLEVKGESVLADLGFTLTVKADRIDLDARSGAHLYDYKTGQIPSKSQQIAFDMQLLLEAAMAERGDFEGLHPRHIEGATYLGVGAGLKSIAAPLDEKPTAQVWKELFKLISDYQEPKKGYTARRAMEKSKSFGRYDQLSRFGEWDETTRPDNSGVTP
ncbi:double-strand break repair protein AddB [Planktotalea arctica]|uniref:double-strand break repair protein AddB n=1 Tax=Planktotalea arctica TaxID=1481893 RepID=UPI003219864C